MSDQATSDGQPPDGLDPSRVDETNPPPNETCQIVGTTTSDGRPLAFALHAVAPLTGDEQAMLGGIVERVIELEEQTHPHAGVVQELMAASMHCRRVVRAASESELADRLGAAIQAVRSALDTTQAELVEARLDAATSEASLDHVHTSLIEHLDLAGELSLPEALAAVPGVVDERDAARIEVEQLRERAETAIDLIDEYDGPHASFEDHPKWTAVRDTLRGNPEPSPEGGE